MPYENNKTKDYLINDNFIIRIEEYDYRMERRNFNEYKIIIITYTRRLSTVSKSLSFTLLKLFI